MTYYLLLQTTTSNYTVFHKKVPFYFLSQFSEMMINLHEIFNRCSWKIL